MPTTPMLRTRAEALATDHLRSRGIEIVDSNWRCPYGEIDFVAIDSDSTAFIDLVIHTERPAVSSTSTLLSRQQRIRRLALIWLHEHSGPFRKIRFDRITVSLAPDRGAQIDHVLAAF